MAINLIVTRDQSEILDILADEDIWSRFSDGVDYNDFYPSLTDSDEWLIVMDGDREIGLIYVKCVTSCAIEFHPYMYKEERIHGRSVIKEFLRWALGYEKIKKINVVIPSKYQQVINFAEKVGFAKEGIDRMSYNNGKCDRIMLGMTRQEAEKWVA